MLVHFLYAVRHQGAVLPTQRHEVCNRSQGGEIGVITPQMGLSEATAEHLNHLESNTDARKNRAFAFRIAFRVGNGNPLGHRGTGLVMVGDHHVYSVGLDCLHLLFAGNAAVHRDNKIGVVPFRPLKGCRSKAVAFLEPLGNKRRNVRAKRAQTPGKHRRGRDAIKIEIAEDENLLA